MQNTQRLRRWTRRNLGWAGGGPEEPAQSGTTGVVRGHGLGGSLAVLAAYRLAVEEDVLVQGIYTFGQPKVGNMGFAGRFGEALSLAEDGSPHYRLVYKGDIVPRLKPPYVATKRLVTDTLSPYVHFGSLLFLEGAGALRANPGVLEELDANLFDLRDAQNHEMVT